MGKKGLDDDDDDDDDLLICQHPYYFALIYLAASYENSTHQDVFNFFCHRPRRSCFVSFIYQILIKWRISIRIRIIWNWKRITWCLFTVGYNLLAFWSSETCPLSLAYAVLDAIQVGSIFKGLCFAIYSLTLVLFFDNYKGIQESSYLLYREN